MQFSDDEKHQATLNFMSEVLEYLRRLPPVPVTKEFCSRIERHLAQPTQYLVGQFQRREMAQVVYSDGGLPVLEARLVGAELTLRIPQAERLKTNPQGKEEVTKRLMRRLLGEGFVLQLEPCDSSSAD